MKKLLLLATALMFAVSCNTPKPEADPAPKPEPPKPTEKPFINRTSATVQTLDTLHIFIANAPAELVEWAATDIYMLQPTNEEATIFQAFAYGTVTLFATYDGVEYTCEVTINKVVDKPQYDMPILNFALTLEEVKAEAAKTSTLIEEETTPAGITFLTYELNAPTIAPVGQMNEYAFQAGKLMQSTIYAKYATEEDVTMPWIYLLERCYYLGQNEQKYDLGIDRETQTLLHFFGRRVLTAGKVPILFASIQKNTQKPIGAPAVASKGVDGQKVFRSSRMEKLINQSTSHFTELISY